MGFSEGDVVCLIPEPEDVMESPTWVDAFYGEPEVTLGYRNATSGHWYISGPGPLAGWCINEKWIVPKPVFVNICPCDLNSGCVCGVMVAEMVALGKVYDPYLRYYVKKETR